MTVKVQMLIYVDDNNQPYLLWGQGKCWIVALEKDMATFKEEPVLHSDHFYLSRGKDLNVFVAGVYNEGPHLQKKTENT